MVKKIEEKKCYLLKIKHYGRELDYKGKIMWIKGELFKIATEDENKLVFNLKQIFYSKEIPESELKIKKYVPIKIKGILKKD
ncbi:MAG: hypothetical protein WC812_01250 [Candidatus Pacearchaeota archaeon]|jgi:hypothetical protein